MTYRNGELFRYRLFLKLKPTWNRFENGPWLSL